MTVWRKGTGWASTLAGVLLVWGTLTGLQVREASADALMPVPVADAASCDNGCKNGTGGSCASGQNSCSQLTKDGCDKYGCSDDPADSTKCKCQ